MINIKRIFLISILFVLSIGITTSFAQTSTRSGQLAGGLMLGEPTGLSFKYWNNNRKAIDVGVAWSFEGSDVISLHADYLWHKWLNVDSGRLALYYGIGARTLLDGSNTVLGARIPIGLNYLLQDAPIGLFLEVAPIIDVIPSTDGNAAGGIGARFYF